MAVLPQIRFLSIAVLLMGTVYRKYRFSDVKLSKESKNDLPVSLRPPVTFLWALKHDFSSFFMLSFKKLLNSVPPLKNKKILYHFIEERKGFLSKKALLVMGTPRPTTRL